jgi:hypothetical protein
MDNETKAAALEKANAIEFNIGAPKEQPAYLDNYPVTPQSYFNNSMLAYHYRQIFKFSKVNPKFALLCSYQVCLLYCYQVQNTDALDANAPASSGSPSTVTNGACGRAL